MMDADSACQLQFVGEVVDVVTYILKMGQQIGK